MLFSNPFPFSKQKVYTCIPCHRANGSSLQMLSSLFEIQATVPYIKQHHSKLNSLKIQQAE